MTRPPFEVAGIVRTAGSRFRQRYWRSLTWPQIKVLNAIARCRTADLGGHRDQCDRCGYQAISFNSCRNRHCPKCQANAREKWLRRRQQELLPVVYHHLVFSVPHALVPLIWQNKKILFSLLFEATAATLLEVGAADPNHLGAEIGFFGILHTWGQTLQQHPHIHCVVPGGGLSPDHTRWISSRSNFFLPVKVLSRVFRGKFTAELRRAFRAKQLAFYGECLPLADEKSFRRFLRTLFQQDWVVYSKPPFGGPDHVLQYLARYTHRVAISNHRIVSVTESEVKFRWERLRQSQ
jgi:putative transposase/transposase-like zinc-binding protein